MGIKSFVRNGLTSYWDFKYHKKLRNYQPDYMEWLKSINITHKKPVIDFEDREIVLLSFIEGEWTPDAKKNIREYMIAHPESLIVYGDEDVLSTDGTYEHPWLKPCWSPDTFLYKDFLGGAVAVKRELYDKLNEEEKKDPIRCHKRLTTLAGGFERSCKTIGHMDGILFHRINDWQYSDAIAVNTESQVSQTWLENLLVSVIIPSKDNVTVLKQCIGTILETVTQVSYEIIIVDNGSSGRTKIQINEYIKKINHDLTNKKPLRSIQYIYEPMEFNFSHICNLGASRASGNLLLFINDDVEAVEKGWMEQMVAKAILPRVGAVGVKLLYPDTACIQHVGITNLPIGPVHKLQLLKDDKCYYDDRNRGIRNVLAVTGACMMLRREVFDEFEGFCEDLRVTYNDVDLCFSLFEQGYVNVVINTCHLLHHESLSRGQDTSDEQKERLKREQELLYQRHPGLKGNDPYYHKWLNQNGTSTTKVEPAYLDGIVKTDRARFQKIDLPKDLLPNPCLLLSIETIDTKMIQGYGVILGSDNACYTRKLIFQSESDSMEYYSLEVQEQFRADIAENMPDQRNIALCGFQTEFSSFLPNGVYRIGMMATDRISKTKLINFSESIIHVEDSVNNEFFTQHFVPEGSKLQD